MIVPLDVGQNGRRLKSKPVFSKVEKTGFDGAAVE